MALAIAVLAVAAPGAAAPPYANPTPGAALVLQIPGMHRAQVRRAIVYRRSPALRMDVYRPRGAPLARALPAVLIGGPPAFRAGKDSGQKVGWSQLVAASGMAAVAFDIRSDGLLERPEQPTADVAAAVAYVRANAAALGIDGSRLCTLGFSIGTAPWHLAAVMREPTPEVRCNVVFYGPLDFESPAWREDLGADPAKLADFAAATHLRRHSGRIAPMFVAKAGREGNRGINESIDRFSAAARELGAPVQVVTQPQGGHGFDLSDRSARSRTIIRQALAFFRRHLLAARAPASAAKARPPLRLTDVCVPAAERRRAVRFSAADGTRLIGLVLGSGENGVVLAHEAGATLCSWLPHARRLAASGLSVLVFDARGRGSSGSARTVPNLQRIDLDVVAAAGFLRSRGVTRVVLGGASAGGTAAIVAAARAPAVAGVLTLSSPSTYVRMDAAAAIRRVTAPMLLVAAVDDVDFPAEARTLHAAATSAEKRIEIVPGGEHGTRMLRAPRVRSLVEGWIAARFSG